MEEGDCITSLANAVGNDWLNGIYKTKKQMFDKEFKTAENSNNAFQYCSSSPLEERLTHCKSCKVQLLFNNTPIMTSYLFQWSNIICWLSALETYDP